MPRRCILSSTERESLPAMPDTGADLIRHYAFSEADLAIIRQRRGAANHLGFGVQRCYMRYPGVMSAIALRDHGRNIDDGLLQFLSPLGWEQINPTGDYVRRNSTKVGPGKFRSLRPLPSP